MGLNHLLDCRRQLVRVQVEDNVDGGRLVGLVVLKLSLG